MSSARLPAFLLAAVLAVLALSGVGPRDRLTWWLEVAPVLKRRRVATRTGSAISTGVLCLGGHYTYAEVPLGFWAKDLLGLARNPYDRVGHLMQGFVPALVVREVLLRTSPLRRGGWLFLLGTGLVLALSAVYELVEWGAALILGQGADAFLGMQGNPWDTQWDMFMCLVGALLSQLLLARLHDRQLAALAAAPSSAPERSAA